VEDHGRRHELDIIDGGSSDSGSMWSTSLLPNAGPVSDGKIDILWYNSSSGQLVEWLLNGTSVLGRGSPRSAASPWLIQGMNAD
jgi:hypothetical protein